MKDGVRARYTLEFKQDAVRLVRGGDKPSVVARTLSVVRRRPPVFAGGMNGAVSSHSRSVISLGYRKPSRLCSRRAIPVHPMAHSISLQRRLNHKILVLLNYFRIRL